MKPLVLLPPVKGARKDGERIAVNPTFLSGVERFRESWPGGWLRVLMEQEATEREHSTSEIDPRSLPYELELIDYDTESLEERIEDAAVVLGALGYRQNSMPARCRRLGVPFVTTSEHTLRTRHQMVRADTHNPVLKARRMIWEVGQERENRRAARDAAAIQCNGTPTYEAYRALNREPLLYFDGRVSEQELIEPEALELRLRRLQAGEPLHLAFYGALTSPNGAPFLVPLAKALAQRGVNFRLSICGAGPCSADMRHALAANELADRVQMKGELDFRRELLPFLQDEADLFVCPHIQGEPSNSYIETLACGLPIVGFANEALVGLRNLAPVGWCVDLLDVEGLASRIEDLDHHRGMLAERSRQARDLATHHTFEETFQNRIDHLLSVAR